MYAQTIRRAISIAVGLAIVSSLMLVGALPAEASSSSLTVGMAPDWQQYSTASAPHPVNFTATVANTSRAPKTATVTMVSGYGITKVVSSAFARCGANGSPGVWTCTVGMAPGARVRLGILVATRFDIATYRLSVTAKASGESGAAKTSALRTVTTTTLPSGANKCGPGGSDWPNRLKTFAVPDRFGPVSFANGCNQHDYCYGGADASGHVINYTRWTRRSACDRALSAAMTAACLHAPAYLTPLYPGFKPTCLTLVPTYYAALRAMGGGPYLTGHYNACSRLRDRGLLTAAAYTSCRAKALALKDDDTDRSNPDPKPTPRPTPTPGPDVTAPTITALTISASTTTGAFVSFSIAAADAAGTVTHLQVKDSGEAWRAAVPFVSSGTMGMTDSYGPKTLWFRVRDAAGNWSNAASANVTRLAEVNQYLAVYDNAGNPRSGCGAWGQACGVSYGTAFKLRSLLGAAALPSGVYVTLRGWRQTSGTGVDDGWVESAGSLQRIQVTSSTAVFSTTGGNMRGLWRYQVSVPGTGTTTGAASGYVYVRVL